MKIQNKLLAVFLSVLLVVLSGCSDTAGMASVQKKTGATELVHIPDCGGCFIFRKDDGSIWYAESNRFTKAVYIIQLMPQQRVKAN
jgi:hypothetical protein